MQSVAATAPIGGNIGAVIQNQGGQSLLQLQPDEVIRLYRATGAILFRGFQASLEEFEQFTSRFTEDLYTNRGAAFSFGPFARSTVNGNPTVLTATGNRQDFPLPLHGEFYYFRYPPRMIWFYCACPAPTGGETTIGDGAAIMSSFRPETADLFRRRRITYARMLDDGEWQTAFQTEDREAVEAICGENEARAKWGSDGSLSTEYQCFAYIRDEQGREVFINDLLPVTLGEIAVRKGQVPEMKKPPLMLRWEDGSPLAEEVIEEVAAAASRCEVPVAAKAGDVLMLDNQRILHGRRYSPPGNRKVLVRMGAPKF
jgi:alpha-ketoglutarate-dependent taurine dioxygenase